MPGSAVASQLSWAAYLFAAAGLILVGSPLVTGTLQASRAGADMQVVLGISQVAEELSPGLRANITIPSVAGNSSVILRGDTITMVQGSSIISVHSTANFAGAILYPSHPYSLSLVDGVVEAVEVG